MFDGDTTTAVLTEAAVALVVPGAVLFAGVWAAFRFVFDDTVRSFGVAPVAFDISGDVVVVGVARLLLVGLVAAAGVALFLGVYLRHLRPRLRTRGIV